jgi:hypothetical protein
VGKMFADDVAAGGAKDIADKEDIHWKSLHGASRAAIADCVEDAEEKPSAMRCGLLLGVLAFCPWHRVGDFN